MSETKVIDTTDVICDLKAAVKALECRNKMQLLKQKVEQQQQAPVFVLIPVEEVHKDKGPCQLSRKQIIHTDRTLKSTCRKKSKLTDLKFPEMRGGVLYTKCMCLHRNGLQDSCPLTKCQGQPQCLVTPWPICPPAKFIRSRYPGQYPMPIKSDRRKC
ncbi:uncharacterized protein LOC122633317 [Vespula pensylvanica]|uniref:uncharacterized protein LOC122633317 n=1 Tax=Vespula pensylvanica TaxID=30213 RepID=UPI001CB9E8EE|nr:uncharacterized protein LOC122633317 [Vespula pensylvanica]